MRLQRCQTAEVVIDARQINVIDYSGVEELQKLEGVEECPIRFAE